MFYEYDFGPKFNYNDMRGLISMEPPAIRQTLPRLAPKVDADGNEQTGVGSVLHQAPLGSYLGWNVFATGFDKGLGCGLVGGYVPLRENESRARGGGRSSVVAGGAVRDAREDMKAVVVRDGQPRSWCMS